MARPLIPGYLRRALARLVVRLTGWPPCRWCGQLHDPREHYILPDEGERP